VVVENDNQGCVGRCDHSGTRDNTHINSRSWAGLSPIGASLRSTKKRPQNLSDPLMRGCSQPRNFFPLITRGSGDETTCLLHLHLLTTRQPVQSTHAMALPTSTHQCKWLSATPYTPLAHDLHSNTHLLRPFLSHASDFFFVLLNHCDTLHNSFRLVTSPSEMNLQFRPWQVTADQRDWRI
jgi:hypothetical protein